MEKIIEINSKKYEVVKNYKDGIVIEELESKVTEYFDNYDYIVGDWAYNKMRLKGFYDAKNTLAKDFNSIANVDTYIKNSCAYDCRYFILKKII